MRYSQDRTSLMWVGEINGISEQNALNIDHCRYLQIISSFDPRLESDEVRHVPKCTKNMYFSVVIKAESTHKPLGSLDLEGGRLRCRQSDKLDFNRSSISNLNAIS